MSETVGPGTVKRTRSLVRRAGYDLVAAAIWFVIIRVIDLGLREVAFKEGPRDVVDIFFYCAYYGLILTVIAAGVVRIVESRMSLEEPPFDFGPISIWPSQFALLGYCLLSFSAATALVVGYLVACQFEGFPEQEPYWWRAHLFVLAFAVLKATDYLVAGHPLRQLAWYVRTGVKQEVVAWDSVPASASLQNLERAVNESEAKAPVPQAAGPLVIRNNTTKGF
jgi:hypothetical protein